MRRELTGEEILIAADEMRRLAEWEAAMAWARTLYGDQEVAVTVEVESEYDDEGGYYDSISDVSASGRNGVTLLPDPDAEKSKELLDEEHDRIERGEMEPLDWDDRAAVAARLDEILDNLNIYDLQANEVVLTPVDGTTTYRSWDKPTVRFGTLYVDDGQPAGAPQKVMINVHIEGGQVQGCDAPDWIEVVIHDDMEREPYAAGH